MPNFSDDELAQQLQARITKGQRNILVIANKYSVRILTRDAAPDCWTEVGQGELGANCLSAMGPMLRANQVEWADTSEADLAIIDCASVPVRYVKKADVTDWQKSSKLITSGRNGEVTNSTKFEVASLAGWRCQFDGCGEDLRSHLAPGVTGNFSYFAHIVGSSSDGPRGDPVESPKLANDPSNIMLMCDKCHRLIDRISPKQYEVALLREMRQNNILEVKRLLDNLRFPAVQMVVVGGSIEGQQFVFDERVAEEAMWTRKLRSHLQRPESFAKNGAHLGASNTNVYWLSLFHLLKTDIPRLQALLHNAAYGSVPLALFPLHGTSTLVLTGRLVGDASTVHLLQFNRDQVAGTLGGQWAWPVSSPKPPADKYKLNVLRAHQGSETEAVLRVCLTASPQASDLPENLYVEGNYTLPTVEVTVDAPSYRAISHPDDLELFGRKIGETLQLMQDNWEVRTIHLVVVAPTTACFRLGQKMQARHHADFVLYERLPSTEPGKQGLFAATIHITSKQVVLASTGEAVSIS